jgi:anti-sigma-K factor RskA/putative zinc finger protein
MTCQELHDLFELYALGVLDAEERAEIDAHLARGCEICGAALSNALLMNTGVLSLTGGQAPSKRLKRRILHAIGAHDHYWGWGWVWALGGAVALAIAVWLGVQERQRTAELADARRTLLEVSDERDRLTAALQFLSDPQTVPASFGKGQTAPPRGYVFLHPQMGVLLIASNLPPAGEGKTYEMWVIPKGGAPRPAGLFQSKGTRALHILNGSLDPATIGTVAVTVEPAAGSSTPTMPIIIAAAIGT